MDEQNPLLGVPLTTIQEAPKSYLNSRAGLEISPAMADNANESPIPYSILKEAQNVEDGTVSYTQNVAETQAANQPIYKTWGNMLVQLGGTILGEAVNLVGATQNIATAIEKGDTRLMEWTNPILETGHGIMDYTQKEFPIYRANPDKTWDMGDSAWWAQGLVSVGSGIGMILGSKGISAIGKVGGKLAGRAALAGLEAAGVAEEAAAIGSRLTTPVTNFLAGEGAAAKLANKALTYAGTGAKPLGTAILMRNSENVSESRQVYKDVTEDALGSLNKMSNEEYEKYLSTDIGKEYLAKGGNRDKTDLAKFIGDKAAMYSYKVNAVNLLSDYLQMLAVYKAAGLMKTSGVASRSGVGGTAVNIEQAAVTAGRELTQQELKSLRVKGAIAGAKATIYSSLGEGAEEIINHIGSEEGKNYGKRLVKGDDSIAKGSLDRVSEYFGDGHLWESGFFGLLGGIAFDKGAPVVQKAYSKMMGEKYNGSASAQIEEIKSRKEILTAANEAMKELKAKRDAGEISDESLAKQSANIRNSLARNLSLNAAKSGNSALLQEMLSSESSKADLKSLMNESGLTLDDAQHEEIHNEMLQSVKEAEDVYNKYHNKLRAAPVHESIKNEAIAQYADSELRLNRLRDIKTRKESDSSLLQAKEDSTIGAVVHGQEGFDLLSITHAIHNLKELEKANPSPAMTQEINRLSKFAKTIEQSVANQDGKTEDDVDDAMYAIHNTVSKEAITAKVDALLHESLYNIQQSEHNTLVKKDLVTYLKEQREQHIAELQKRNFEELKATVKSKFDDGSLTIEYLEQQLALPVNRNTNVSNFLNAQIEKLKQDAAIDDTLTEPDIVHKTPEEIEAERVKEANRIAMEEANKAERIRIQQEAVDAKKAKEEARKKASEEKARQIAEDKAKKAANKSKNKTTTTSTDKISTSATSATELTLPPIPLAMQQELDANKAKAEELAAMEQEEAVEEINTIDEQNTPIVEETISVPTTPQLKAAAVLNTLGVSAKPAIEYLNGLANNTIPMPDIDGTGAKDQLKSDVFKLLLNGAIKGQSVEEAIDNLKELLQTYKDDGMNNTPVTDYLQNVINGFETYLNKQTETNIPDVPVEEITTPILEEGVTDIIEQIAETVSPIEETKIELVESTDAIEEQEAPTPIITAVIEEAEQEVTSDKDNKVEDALTPIQEEVVAPVQEKIVEQITTIEIETPVEEETKFVIEESIETPVIFIPAVNRSASIFIPAMMVHNETNVWGGIKEVGEGEFQLSADATAVFEQLAAIKVGDTVTLEVDTTNEIYEKTKHSSDDVPIKIVINGVDVGYLNSLNTQLKQLAQLQNLISSNPESAKNQQYSIFAAKLSANIAYLKEVRPQVVANGKVTTTVSYKTSGTKIQGVEKKLSDVLVGDYEIMTVAPADAGNAIKIESLVGTTTRWTPNVEANAYYNHDNRYSAGQYYALVNGLNSTDDVKTKIPLRLIRGQLGTDGAVKLNRVINELIDFMVNTPNAKLNNEHLVYLRGQIKDLIILTESNTNKDGTIPIPLFKIHADRIEFLFDDYKKIGRIYFNKHSHDGLRFIVNDFNNVKDDDGNYVTNYTSKEQFNSTISKEKSVDVSEVLHGKNAFSDALKEAFSSIKYRIDDTAIRNGKTTIEQIVEEGRLVTDTGVLLDANGNKVSNFYAKHGVGMQGAGGNFEIRLSNQLSTIEDTKVDSTISTTDETIAVNVDTSVEDSTSLPVKSANESLTTDTQTEISNTEETKKEEVIPPVNIVEEIEDEEVDADDFDMLATPDLTPTYIEEERVRANIRRMFGDNVDLNIVEAIVKKGVISYGVYRNGMISVAKYSPLGTEYHEAFHAVMDMYLEEDERQEIYATAKLVHGELTDRNLEEKLAEEFRAYANAKQVGYDMPVIGAVRRFFDKLFYYINNIMDRDNVRNLYRGIASGAFNRAPDGRSRRFNDTRHMMQDELDAKFKKEEIASVINHMVGRTAEWLSDHSLFTEKEMIERNTKTANGKTTIKRYMLTPQAFSIAALEAHEKKLVKAGDTINAELIRRFIDEIYYTVDDKKKVNTKSLLLKRYNEAVKKILNFEFEYSDDYAAFALDNIELTAEQTKEWDDTAGAKKSSKESFDADLRRFIMSTQRVTQINYLLNEKGDRVLDEDGNPIVKDGFMAAYDTQVAAGNLGQFIDFNKIYPMLQVQMANSGNKEEMMSRLYNLAKAEPSMMRLWDKLMTASNKDVMINKWFTNFNKVYFDADHYRLKDNSAGIEVTKELSNKRYALSNKWKNTIELMVSQRNADVTSDDTLFTEFNKDLANKFIEELTNLMREEVDIQSAAEYIEEIGKLVGMELPATLTTMILNNTNLRKGLSVNKYLELNILNPLKFVVKNIYNNVGTEKPIIFNNTGDLNTIAIPYMYFMYDANEPSYINTEGNVVYSFNKPTWAARFFETLDRAFNPYNTNVEEAMQNLLNQFKEYAKDESLGFSNYMWSDGEQEGFFKVAREKKAIEELNVNDLNISMLRNFKMRKADGLKNVNTKTGLGYAAQSESDFDLFTILGFVTGHKNAKNFNHDVISIPTVVKSDSGNIWNIEAKRFRIIEKGQLAIDANGKITRNSDLFKAVINTAYQEMKRMDTALNYLFVTYNSGINKVVEVSYLSFTGKDVIDKEVNEGDIVAFNGKQAIVTSIKSNEITYEVLADNATGSSVIMAARPDVQGQELRFHYQKLDKNDKPILYSTNNGITTLTGNVFKHHNMNHNKNGKWTSLSDEIGNMTSVRLADGSMLTGTFIRNAANSSIIAARNEAVKAFTESFIKQEIANIKADYGQYREDIETMNTKGTEVLDNYLDVDGYSKFDQMLSELAINTYIHYVEHANFFNGFLSEYKDEKDTNKRAKQIDSPVLTAPTLGRDLHRTIIATDIELASTFIEEYIDNAIKFLSADTSLASLPVNKELIKKRNHKPANEMERKVMFMIAPYLNTNIADAQGYITMDYLKYTLTRYGRWNRIYDMVYNKVAKGEDLTFADLELIENIKGHFQVIKPFYYNRTYDNRTKSMRSTQIKTSVVPLIPQLVKGTEMERILNYMTDEQKHGKGNTIDALYFQSAAKVGMGVTSTLHNKNGNLLENFEDAVTIQDYNNADWGIQLDVPSHLKDEHNKLGVQIAKIPFANLSQDAIYDLNEEHFTGKEVTDKFHKLLEANVKEAGERIVKELGGELLKDENGTPILDSNNNVQYKFKDLKKVQQKLVDELRSKGMSDNVIDSLVLVNDEFSGQENFNIPLFVNNMASKYQAILTALFTNNVTIQKFSGGHVTLASDALLTNIPKIETDENLDTTGIEFHDSVKDRVRSGNFRLNPPRWVGDKIVSAEALLPAWSKKFFKDGQRMSINDIPQELRTLIGYRIPTEAKYSSIVFEVVGFLPEIMDSTIIMPHELVTQTGWDFDVDSLYMMQKDIVVNDDGTLSPPKLVEDIATATKEERQAVMFDIFKSILTNPFHYQELTTAGGFEDAKDLKAHYESMKFGDGKGGKFKLNINPMTRRGQNHFRNANIAGRALKGLAANTNGIGPVLQYLKAGFSTPFIFKYDASKYSYEDMVKKYGEANVSFEGEVISIVNNDVQDNLAAMGVRKINTNLTVAQTNMMLSLLMPQIKKQAYIENKARTANYMFSFGKRWARVVPNSGEISEQGKQLGTPRPNRITINSKEGMTYGYFSTDQNNQSLPDIKDLQPIMDYIQSVIGIDMSNYDAMLGNIYEDNSFIHQHRDTTESITAEQYPVIVINLGADGVLEFDKENNSYATYNKTGSIDLENGSIYAFGIDGKNRFTFHHRIESGLKSATPTKSITLSNGKVLSDYRITLTFRRAADTNISKPKTIAIDSAKIRQTKKGQLGLFDNQSKAVNNKRTGNIVVNHTRIAHNADGTYNNINGDTTTAHNAQMLAMILDIVKEGVPYNINTYTFNTFAAMVLSGTDILHAGMLVAQPIITELAETNLKAKGVMSEKVKEVEIIKGKYQAKLAVLRMRLRQLKREDLVNNGFVETNDEGKIISYKGEKITMKRFDTIKLLGYDPDAVTSYSLSEMEDMIKITNPNIGLLGKKDYTQDDYRKLADFYTKQLHILEMWNGITVFDKKTRTATVLAEGYKKLGDGFGDVINILNTDKIGAGPKLDVTDNWQRKANKVKADRRILTDIDGEKIDVTSAVFDMGQYGSFKAFLESSNLAATSLFSDLFINRSKMFMQIKNDILDSMPYVSAAISEKVETFLAKTMMSNIAYLDKFDKNQVLGINQTPTFTNVTDITDITIDEFKQLSTANQLYYVKKYIGDGGNNSILHYLNYQLDNTNLEKKKIHYIKFDKPNTTDGVDDDLVRSFEDMLYGGHENPAYNDYLITLANNLIAYDMITTGNTFSSNSWNNFIPLDYITGSYGLNLGNELRRKQSLANAYGDNFARTIAENQGLHPTDIDTAEIKKEVMGLDADRAYTLFMQNHWFDNEVVPTIKESELETWNQVGFRKTVNHVFTNEGKYVRADTTLYEFYKGDDGVTNRTLPLFGSQFSGIETTSTDSINTVRVNMNPSIEFSYKTRLELENKGQIEETNEGCK